MHATAAGIKGTLTEFLVKQSLNNDIMREQFTGFCSDGTSYMICKYLGVATLLETKYPLVKNFHCIAYGLDLLLKIQLTM